MKQKKKSKSAALAMACVGATTAACTSAPVRKQPPPEACPPGAAEVMEERLDIASLPESPSVILPGFELTSTSREPIPVREGPTQVLMRGEWRNMPPQTTLFGRFIIGKERVYGRFTEVELPSGERLPVCLALVEQGPEERQGVPIEAEGGPGFAKVYPFAQVRVVDRFE